MKKIKVIFETITPLWTGDAWGENSDIRPSSVMGSLRFWFYVYCKQFGIPTERLNGDNLPVDSIDAYIKPYKFNSLLLKTMEDKNCGYNGALKTVLIEEIKLPLISIIFGCTGWKSQIKVKEIKPKKIDISKDKINFTLSNRRNERYSSKFWANKLLFKGNKRVSLFSQLNLTIEINELFLCEFKKFLKFYRDNVIVCGGKKSLGFGFCRLSSDINLNDVSIPQSSSKEVFSFKEIELNDFYKEGIILGFNFKYYQRSLEKPNFRKKNFGSKEQASNFFFSTKLSNQSKIYLIGFNFDGDCDNECFEKKLSKYSKFNSK